MNGSNDLIRPLLDSVNRIMDRKDLIRKVPVNTRLERLARLRDVMFIRRSPGKAFQMLNDEELALVRDAVEERIGDGSLVLGNESGVFWVLRYNYLTGTSGVDPYQFRQSAGTVANYLLRLVLQKSEFVPADTTVLLPWRAGLAFGPPATERGFRSFYHLGVRRDEKTLEVSIYLEEIPQEISEKVFSKVLIADPMLATGNTLIHILKRLLSLGIELENIIIASIIAAPEGVDHVLHRYPGVRIFTGALDEGLDENGYIFPGLGDFGDLYFEGLTRKDIAKWCNAGILSQASFETLCDWMGV